MKTTSAYTRNLGDLQALFCNKKSGLDLEGVLAWADYPEHDPTEESLATWSRRMRRESTHFYLRVGFGAETAELRSRLRRFASMASYFERGGGLVARQWRLPIEALGDL